jgi:hypothetical protein
MSIKGLILLAALPFIALGARQRRATTDDPDYFMPMVNNHCFESLWFLAYRYVKDSPMLATQTCQTALTPQL